MILRGCLKRLAWPAGIALVGHIVAQLALIGFHRCSDTENILLALLGLLLALIAFIGTYAVPLAGLLAIALITDTIVEGTSPSTATTFNIWGCATTLTLGGIGLWAKYDLGLNFKSVWDAFDAFLEYLVDLELIDAVRSLFALFPERTFILAGVFLVLSVLGLWCFRDKKWFEIVSWIVAAVSIIFCASALFGAIILVLIFFGLIWLMGLLGEVEIDRRSAHSTANIGMVHVADYNEAKYIVNNPSEFEWHEVLEAQQRLKELEGDE